MNEFDALLFSWLEDNAPDFGTVSSSKATTIKNSPDYTRYFANRTEAAISAIFAADQFANFVDEYFNLATGFETDVSLTLFIESCMNHIMFMCRNEECIDPAIGAYVYLYACSHNGTWHNPFGKIFNDALLYKVGLKPWGLDLANACKSDPDSPEWKSYLAYWEDKGGSI